MGLNTDEMANTAKVVAQHPLQTTLVFRRIAAYLPFECLKTSRDVCQVWNQECVPLLRRRSKMQFFELTPVSLGEKEICLATSENYPCQNFRIAIMTAGIFSQLFNHIGRWAVDMMLSFYPEKIAGGVNIAKFNPFFPHLQSVTVMCFTYITLEKMQENAEILCKILKGAPRLKDLEFNVTGDDMLLVLLQTRNFAAYSNQISSLSVRGKVTKEQFRLIANSDLKLKQLSIEFEVDTTRANETFDQEMQNLLCSQKNTLETLKICFGEEISYDFKVTFKFPCMKKLSSFSLHVDIETAEWQDQVQLCVVPINLDFSKQFPSLKKLELIAGRDQIMQFLSPCKTLDELHLDPNRFFKSMSQQVELSFPNLTNFEVDWSLWIDECPTWPNLVKLTIKFASPETGLDRFILGVTKSQYQCLKWQYKKGMPLAQLELMYYKFKISKTIRDLTNLKTLQFRKVDDSTENMKTNAVFTDLSCCLVLLKMESLNCLEFSGFSPSIDKISGPVRCAMQHKFQTWC